MRVSFLSLVAAVAVGACAAEPSTLPAGAVFQSRAVRPPDRDSVALVSVRITYRGDAPPTRRKDLKALGARLAYDVDHRKVMLLTIPKARAASIDSLGWIESVEIDSAPPHEIQGAGVAGDLISWGLQRTGTRAVHLNLGNRGAGVRVGVLDTRLRCDHGDLAGRVVGGYDFVDDVPEVCPALWNALEFPAHGTQVAGIIAASENGSGVLGVAPEAAIYSLRVCDDHGLCDRAPVEAALEWALKRRLDVLNLSFAPKCDDSLATSITDLLRELHEAGTTVVASAGNATSPGCTAPPPSAYTRAPGVIGVSHWLQNDTQLESFRYGEGINLAAPSAVETADPNSGVNMSKGPGTSYAAPHVTGAIALLIRQGFRTPALLQKRLEETATDRGPAGWDDHWGWGTLNVGAAVVRAPVVTAIETPPLPITAQGNIPVSATVSWGAGPLSFTWSVSYSNPSAGQGYSVTGGTSLSVWAPAGSYAITVTATPRESVYGRVGSPQTVTIPVCTTAGPQYALGSRPERGGGRPIGPQRKAGC